MLTLTYFSRSQANKRKSLSSLYLHTYSLYYFHINTSDSYDETGGQVLRWVTFTYCSRSLANKGKSLSSQYLRTNSLYYFHINTSESYDKTVGQGHRCWYILVHTICIALVSIQLIELIKLYVRFEWAWAFLLSNIIIAISRKTPGQGKRLDVFLELTYAPCAQKKIYSC